MASNLQTKVVLQDRNSSLYFEEVDRWTADVNQAKNFEHIRKAHEFARSTRNSHLDIVMIFADRKYDIRLRGSP